MNQLGKNSLNKHVFFWRSTGPFGRDCIQTLYQLPLWNHQICGKNMLLKQVPLLRTWWYPYHSDGDPLVFNPVEHGGTHTLESCRTWMFRMFQSPSFCQLKFQLDLFLTLDTLQAKQQIYLKKRLPSSTTPKRWLLE